MLAFERSRGELQRSSQAPVEIVLCSSLPLAAGVAVLAGPVVRTVYGGAYHGAVPSLIILGFTLIPMYMNIVLGQICVAAERPGQWTRLLILATVVNPAINAFLIRRRSRGGTTARSARRPRCCSPSS